MMRETQNRPVVILVLVFIIDISRTVSGQGILPDQSPFFCVPPGICLGGIDPRIVTPENNGKPEHEDLQELIDKVFNNKILTDGTQTPGIATCPAGKIPCYAQGSMSSCGQRKDGISEEDGLADDGAYPWLGYLMGPNEMYLGVGSLLSPYHVLTAAHKVLAYSATPERLSVYFSVTNPATLKESSKPNSTAAQIFIHPDHNNNTLRNDIAVIRLLNPIGLLDPNTVNTICLPAATATTTTFTEPPQGCLVSGWGQIQPNNTAVPTQLKQVNVKTTNMDECEKGFSGKIDTNLYLDKVGEICAGGEAQKDACFQDGGAPLNCRSDNSRFTVAGIVIWGKSCGQPGVYGVYTNVPTYRSWIVEKLIMEIP